ncbi:hypothetical protein [Duganella callida]|uniref:Uncharacterized protein n=1 Tax=Duganella callida TaxID=2561932 RepID=A0A4Y9SQU3_9BURK|nr:hypothetical protein [Duganella callida]TFW27003.1 hypothetical protein E4L98_08070 [Duganella callida]
MTEEEFIKTVDCRFPYDDEVHASELIELGSAISPNAAFMVLHEICRPPRSSQVVGSRVNELLAEWTAAVHHPLVQEVLPVARAMTQNREISTVEAIRVMKSIAPYRNQFSALSIAYFACDDLTGEGEAEYRSVIDEWDNFGALTA